jgi:hypothetical protein
MSAEWQKRQWDMTHSRATNWPVVLGDALQGAVQLAPAAREGRHVDDGGFEKVVAHLPCVPELYTTQLHRGQAEPGTAADKL